MVNYTGKVCPFCKTEFKENDDIVVCSNCDMPHHKDCWIENQGCTTFGCIGTIKAADETTNTVTATEIVFDKPQASSHIFCTKCGAQHSFDASFCRKCGNSLRSTASVPVYEQTNSANTNPYTYAQPYQQNSYSPNTVIDPDVAALVSTKQEYYLPKFQEMKFQNKKTTWNWVAFFFAPYWFMYRKMYGYGFAALGIAFLINLINSPIFSLLSLGGYITIGLFANYIYMQWIEKNANQAKAMNEPFRSLFVQKHSGVSSNALVLTIIGWVVLMGLIPAM